MGNHASIQGSQVRLLSAFIFCCLFVMPAYAVDLETETAALIQKHAQTETYHARLCLRLAEFALHERKEGDWVDAWLFLRLAREHDSKAQEKK